MAKRLFVLGDKEDRILSGMEWASRSASVRLAIRLLGALIGQCDLGTAVEGLQNWLPISLRSRAAERLCQAGQAITTEWSLATGITYPRLVALALRQIATELEEMDRSGNET